MTEVVKNLALRIKLHKVSGSIVHHVALLKKTLDSKGIPSEMVKGYCIIEESKEACEHYWIRSEGLDLDVAFQVACLRNQELLALRPVLLESLPQGLVRSDSGEIQILAENARLFELFLKDPKAFWREAPKEVSAFSVKDFEPLPKPSS